eukprot:TRINITY_DN8003_c0_g1_i1.p1 TRINITY_DN8003_c0_g1~~TRINITY_DN8003_c0_g1_i1.p1  ORF type:complete len:465 (-),score=121.00 TRINITY_DN8003_c0_g1_i1:48-1442(-)
MKGVVVVFCLVAVLLGCVCGIAVQHEVEQEVAVEELQVRIRINGKEDMDRLTALGINLDHHRTLEEVDAIVTEQDKLILKVNGFQFEQLSKQEHLDNFESHTRRADSSIKYHDYEHLSKFLQEIASNYSSITRLFSLGDSVQNRHIYCLHISDNPNLNEPLEPEFRYVANMHGDETVGRELLVQFITLLTSSYGHDTRLTSLVNSTSIYIVPTMNPDGYELKRRSNARGFDLNRNFPDQFNRGTNPQQKETTALMTFFRSRSFVLAANFHGGSVVANYPFDGNQRVQSGSYAAAPDDSIFKALASTYADSNSRMKASNEFPNGITNGAEWYVLYGGMQDYGYLHYGDLELTIELSNVKNPRESELARYWEENKESMIRYLEFVHKGVYGEVKEKSGGKVVTEAKITVGHLMWVGVDKENGDYYKMLLPGQYSIKCEAKGYKTVTGTVRVEEGKKTRMDFFLEKS